MRLKDFEIEVRNVFGGFNRIGTTTSGIFQADVIVSGRTVTIKLCKVGFNVWSAWENRPGNSRIFNLIADKTSANEALTELKTLLQSGQSITAVRKGSNMASHNQRGMRITSNKLTLTWFKQLAESVFDAVIDVHEIVRANLPAFQANVMVSGQVVTICLQRIAPRSWNAWVPTKIMYNTVVKDCDVGLVALEKIKNLIEIQLVGGTRPIQQVESVKPTIPPCSGVQIEPLTKAQCRNLAEQVFNVQNVIEVVGKENAFQIFVVMYELLTIELSVGSDNRWVAHEPVSNRFSWAEVGETSPIGVLKQLKKKLMS
ncbi:MAG: hypothetical protein ABIH67_01120 [Candidatus Uhrbacteria bacterium]